MALHDQDERREVTYEAASAVLDAQRETLSEVDAKAVRTVRTTVVLLGVLLSAWQIESELFDPAFASAGSIALLGSLVAGTFTYNESDLYLGPSKEYVEQLADGDFGEDDWDQDLLYSFGTWIAENGAEIRFNSHLLSVTQVLFVAGVVSTGLAIAL